MLKKDLRKEFLVKRQKLSREQCEILNEKITNQFFTWLPSSVFTLHIFLPILAKNEFNTWPLIKKLWEKDLNVAVPVMDMSTTTLSTWALTPVTGLQENIWGVPEPVGADFIKNSVIDVVVLPLLAFDLYGYRVGYGKGFYDHFLATFDDPPIKVGLSFFDPVPKISDVYDADIPMDFCITPDKTWGFR